MFIVTDAVRLVHQSDRHDTYEALVASLGERSGDVLASYGNYVDSHLEWVLVVWFWLGLSFLSFVGFALVSARRLLLFRWHGRSPSHQSGDRYR